MMQLSRSLLNQLPSGNITVPGEALLHLPEKVLQFGTGVLLRGLPDYFIDKANKQQVFNGRVVVVKSTGNGGTDAFDLQDGLYTLLERGFEEGNRTERTGINASISRVLSAATQWEEVLACAANPAMQVIISNTTEVGIALVAADAQTTGVPVSFPGKLFHFLLQRYEVFQGSKESGMVIIPTELITDNGPKLKAILLELARLKSTPDAFIDWLDTANDCCSSLVDRIVPGKLSKEGAAAAAKELGYQDDLLIMSECYRLWAIETVSERTRQILSFSKTDTGLVLAPDIDKFRELKLRLLNGTHTFSCGLACLAGFSTVKEAMQDALFAAFINNIMLQEIVPQVVSREITAAEANAFALQVIDRFRNPYLDHLWLNITVQYTSKMAMRNVPLLQKHYAAGKEVPEWMALGFAAYILFMASNKTANGQYEGQINGIPYPIQDDKAAVLSRHWNEQGEERVVLAVLRDTTLWGTDLAQYPGFANAVNAYLASLMQKDAKTILREVVTKKSVA
ncbi:MAG: tagaturonate reductase [Sediminibacterium sp.]